MHINYPGALVMNDSSHVTPPYKLTFYYYPATNYATKPGI